MRAFTFENATKIYFGGGCVKEHLLEAVKPYGETVMLAYGGGSIKTNGIYQEVMDVLKLAGKQVIEFSGIMPNPTYSKVMEGKKVVQENQVDLILAVGGFDMLSHVMETYFSAPDEDNLSDAISEALMRSIIENLPVAIREPENYEARSNLMWASTMAEIGIIKLGKQCDFEAHMIEHQMGAYTDCNHGMGLGVIHPAYYRRICRDGIKKFVKFAVNVWGMSPDGGDEEELAFGGIDALQAFIHEIGLPGTLRELGITDQSLLKTIADSCIRNDGGYRQLTHAEILDILEECY